MRSTKLRVRMLRLIPLFATLACAACAGGPVIVATPSACSSLIPDSWREPVAGADLPDGNTVGDWIKFGDAQTAQLDKANGRTVDTLNIIGRCEARDRTAVKAAKPKFLGVF